MRLAVVAALTFIFASPAHAEPSRAPRKAEAVQEQMHYRTLEKMLRRFAAQAGTSSSGKIFASR